MQLYEEMIEPFVPGEFRVGLVSEAWERAAHFALRRDVFCDEQGIFAGSDIDGVDATAVAIVAQSCVLGSADQVVGTVRIHERAPRLWSGSRLAVHRDFRRVSGIGAALIHMAVSTATARGCDEFLADVQVQNVKMFERLHWVSLGAVERHGRPHHVMRAELAHYAPATTTESRLLRPVAAANATRRAA